MHLRSKSDVIRKAIIRFASSENIRNGAEYLKICNEQFAYEYFDSHEDANED